MGRQNRKARFPTILKWCRVPAVYLTSAFLAFLRVLAFCGISELRAFSPSS
jgi:hypothetical protein